MKAVARLVGLSDAGEGLPIASLGEPAQQLRVELASSASAVMVDVDIDTGLGRPLEGGQALQRLPIRKTDDLIIPLEDEQFVCGAKHIDARSHFGNGRDVDFPTDRCGLHKGAVDRQGPRRHPVLMPDARHYRLLPCHHFPTDGPAAVSGMRVDAI
jgi:hypothetical protein